MGGRSGRKQKQPEREDLWGRIQDVRRAYCISSDNAGSAADDEASISLEVALIQVPKRASRLADTHLRVQLLCAQQYGGESAGRTSSFFGTVNLRKANISALAYLPPKPFWEMPNVIAAGATLLCLGFTRWRAGSGALMSLLICDEQERRELLAMQSP